MKFKTTLLCTAMLAGFAFFAQSYAAESETPAPEYSFSVYDSAIYSQLFTTPEMKAVFNDRQLIKYWLRFEVALAEAEAENGLIPQSAADAIRVAAVPENVNMKALQGATLKVGRPVDGLVKQIRKISPEANKYLHFGSTTQDVMDTATVMQIQDASRQIDRQLRALILQIADLAERYKDTPMVARTNGQDAIPTTYGMMLGSYLCELNRNRERLEAAAAKAAVVQTGSAVGTLSSLGKKGLAVRAALAKKLNLSEPDISWNASRDNYAAVVQALSLTCGTLGRVAGDLNLWSRTADNEVSEGEGGPSSTMPQKRNPRAAEFMGGLAAMARIRAAGALEMLQQTEVRQGAPWISEWSTIPEMFMITSTGLKRASGMFSKLIVRPEVMKARFGDSNNYAMAEAAQQFLAPKMGLGEAHSALLKAIKSAPKGSSFEEVLRTDSVLKQQLSEKDIQYIIDPANYLGLAPELVTRAVEKVRKDLK